MSTNTSPVQIRNRSLFSPAEWNGKDSALATLIEQESAKNLRAYAEQPRLVLEQESIEEATKEGGYGNRQLYELIQNAADALLGRTGRIEVTLTKRALYCANEGRPFDQQGIEAVLSSHISSKRGEEIGRFGLGFKSVLAISRRPEIYSRSVSFGFEEAEALRRIRQVVPDSRVVPTLRIATVLGPARATTSDAVLCDLMSWATTVIKLPLDLSCDWLAGDFEKFPDEFLLFAPQVKSLKLRHTSAGSDRDITNETLENDVVLLSGRSKSTWKVFKTEVRPSERAQADAGARAKRELVTVTWGVPLQGKAADGTFWAYFPTKEATKLSGILHAPWKITADRVHLLEGVFNKELLGAAAKLIAGSAVQLSEPNDPAWYIDVLPGRTREYLNWADDYLNKATYREALGHPFLPDQAGKLQIPAKLRVVVDNLPVEGALEAWAQSQFRPVSWCHHSAYQNVDRSARIRRLAEVEGGARKATTREWLEALTAQMSAENSVAALQVVEELLKSDSASSFLEEVRKARIVLTSDRTMVAPDPQRLFLPNDYASALKNAVFVHPDVVKDDKAQQALTLLGVRLADALNEFSAMLESDTSKFADQDWVRFWKLARLAGSGAADLVKRAANRLPIKVRTVRGGFEPWRHTLMPGRIVPADGSRDDEVAVDESFHAGTLELLHSLGLSEGPATEAGDSSEAWFFRYKEYAIEKYLTQFRANRTKPQSNHLLFNRSQCAGPLSPLRRLSEAGAALFTGALLEINDPPWIVKHDSRSNVYGELAVEPPSIWLARAHGRLDTSLGIFTVAECVGQALSEWAEILPVANLAPISAAKVGIPEKLSDLTQEQWNRAFSRAAQLTDHGLLGRFYGAAVDVHPSPPSRIGCRVHSDYTQRPTTEVFVTHTANECSALADAGKPVLLVTNVSQCQKLQRLWKLRAAETEVRTEVAADAAFNPEMLSDHFPALRRFLVGDRETLMLQRCRQVFVETLTGTGKISSEREVVIHRGTVFARADLDNQTLLSRLDAELSLGLSASDLDTILGQRADRDRRSKVNKVRDVSSAREKLLVAVGSDAIRRRLPATLVATVQKERGTLDDDTLALLATVVYGVDTFRAFRTELEEGGFEPPTRWAGSYSAKRFVQELGLPIEYAGLEETPLEALLEVDGPPNLPQLHDFQKALTLELKKLLKREGGSRGLLALPTGAGKTRVTVQAFTEAFCEGPLKGVILWVAQTEELCEQAVQTWSEVWRGLGPHGRLYISRLWTSNEAGRAKIGTQVVIATIAKLQGCFDDADYDWLSKADAVVIDEAHSAVTPSYTRLLEWQGMGRGKDRCPLLGLTATAFRGHNQEETLRLVNRFGNRRIDEGIFSKDPYEELQSLGVLASVKHHLLEGVNIELTDDELEMLRRTQLFPRSAEERVARNEDRNNKLVHSIIGLPNDWPVLLFAASVEHAETLAALLTLRGVRAAPISAQTDSGARRQFIEDFRSQKIRVLTNYGVLAQGFDAPAVRAVYVARPTFSANLYQQMIGRGLRGPKNGGKAECLVVNVADNVVRYGDKLAFTHFNHLWSRS